MIPKDLAQLALLIQKYSGIAAFVLIFLQILIGRFTKKYKLHLFIAFLIFGLIFAHLFSYVFYIKKIKGLFDPFYPFTDLCILCKNVVYPEYFVNFGRIALWLAAISVVFKKKLHFLNYFALFFIALHAWFLGSDYKTIILGSTLFLFFVCGLFHRQGKFLR